MNELTLESKRRIVGALNPKFDTRQIGWRADEERFDANLALGECVPWMKREGYSLSLTTRDGGTYLANFYVASGIHADPALAIYLAFDQYLLTLEEAKP